MSDMRVPAHRAWAGMCDQVSHVTWLTSVMCALWTGGRLAARGSSRRCRRGTGGRLTSRRVILRSGTGVKRTQQKLSSIFETAHNDGSRAAPSRAAGRRRAAEGGVLSGRAREALSVVWRPHLKWLCPLVMVRNGTGDGFQIELQERFRHVGEVLVVPLGGGMQRGTLLGGPGRSGVSAARCRRRGHAACRYGYPL